MKKLIVVLLLIISSNTFSQSYPHISELRGLEDSLNNTHLFYRYVYPTSCWSKSIYHYDLFNNVDTLFIPDFGYTIFPGQGCEGDYVNDYEFFDNDPTKFIYCGYNLWIDPVALLRRYDGDIYVEAFALTQLEISKTNDSLVYVSAGPGFFKSTDGGYNFVRYDSMQFIDESIISLSKNNDSQIYGIEDSKLVRSEDDGNNYTIVNDSDWRNDSELFYDVDQSHIYGLSVKYNFSTHSYTSEIYVSSNNGDPFTWNTLIELEAKAWFTIDEIISGENYYSSGKKIFKSTDYGLTYTLYKELDQKVTGLYKKSGTNILYASTPLKIYEITPDTIQLIKSLPIPEEVFSFYPLAIGNNWIYDAYHFTNGNTYHDLWVTEVNGIYLQPNGKLYYILRRYHLSQPGEGISYERVDSLSAKIYKYDANLGLPNDEYIIDDLLAEPEDTVHSYRFYLPGNSFTLVIKDTLFEKWGLTKTKRVFQEIGSGIPKPTYSLTQDIGLDSMFFVWDDNINDTYILKGCVIDGIVYGDTTTVGIDDEEAPFVTEFKLEQNYPNPFNPSTKIKFTIPSVETTRRVVFTTLKVYDILGNEIATLVNEEKPAGEYEIEFSVGRDSSPDIASGIYFYQLRAGTFIQTKKMILIK
jgi:hypothetical protein